MITPIIQSKKRTQQKNTPGHRPPTAPANVSSKSQYILLLILILILQWDQTHPKLRVQGGVIATYVRYYKVHDNIRTPSQQSVVASSRTINTTTTAVLLLLRIASRGHNSYTYVSYVLCVCVQRAFAAVAHEHYILRRNLRKRDDCCLLCVDTQHTARVYACE